MITAVLAREFGLGLAACGSDDRRAEMLRPLREDEADAASRGMDEDRVALPHLVGAVEQILDGHALQHHGGGRLVGDAFRQLHGNGRGNVPLGRVAAQRRHVGHAVADAEAGDAVPKRRDLASRLVAGDEGERRRLVVAAAEIGIDVVDADRGLADAELAGPGGRQIDFFVSEYLGPAVLMNPNCRDHVSLPLHWPTH